MYFVKSLSEKLSCLGNGHHGDLLEATWSGKCLLPHGPLIDQISLETISKRTVFDRRRGFGNGNGPKSGPGRPCRQTLNIHTCSAKIYTT